MIRRLGGIARHTPPSRRSPTYTVIVHGHSTDTRDTPVCWPLGRRTHDDRTRKPDWFEKNTRTVCNELFRVLTTRKQYKGGEIHFKIQRDYVRGEVIDYFSFGFRIPSLEMRNQILVRLLRRNFRAILYVTLHLHEIFFFFLKYNNNNNSWNLSGQTRYGCHRCYEKSSLSSCNIKRTVEGTNRSASRTSTSNVPCHKVACNIYSQQTVQRRVCVLGTVKTIRESSSTRVLQDGIKRNRLRNSLTKVGVYNQLQIKS